MYISIGKHWFPDLFSSFSQSGAIVGKIFDKSNEGNDFYR